jgi:protein-disulfide isomerase
MPSAHHRRRFAAFARATTAIALLACSGENVPRSTNVVDSPAVPPVIASTPSRDSARVTPRATPAAITHERAAPPARAAAGPRRVTIAGVDFTGIGYDRGSVTAPVVLIDLSDFACPYCGEFSRETYPAIERDYVQTGKVFFKYVPFVVGSFVHSREATRATECAADQGGFWPMLAKVYDAQREWKASSDPYAVLSSVAGAAGLDTVRLGACYASQRTDARTARVTERANALGVRVTPSFLVNERPVQGALPLEEFRKVIDAALLLSQSRR